MSHRYSSLMFSLRRPSDGGLARMAASQSGLELTYSQAGATAGVMPAGYHHDRWTTDLGPYDDDRFQGAAQALRSWVVQRGAGITVVPGTPVEPGLTFAFSLELPVGFVTAAGRVVYVTDEPRRYGFAYGTLPAHPEEGEEAFHVGRDGSRLLFTIAAFSRPRHPLARLGAPASRALQLRTTRAYQRAMQSAVG
jgi:uncharacterized protein (UPF0548 family)